MRAFAETGPQILRYGIIGLGANAAFYAVYLLLSSNGLGPKSAMTVTYSTSVLCTFIFNRRWTFGHDGAARAAFFRYVAVYAVGYIFNAAALGLLVDVAGLPHRWVMLALILFSAGAIFLLQKYWVFAAGRDVAPLQRQHSGSA